MSWAEIQTPAVDIPDNEKEIHRTKRSLFGQMAYWLQPETTKQFGGKGIAGRPARNFVGGNKNSSGDWRVVVISAWTKNDKIGRCNGFVVPSVARNLVMTAAHCLIDADTGEPFPHIMVALEQTGGQIYIGDRAWFTGGKKYLPKGATAQAIGINRPPSPYAAALAWKTGVYMAYDVGSSR